MDKEQIRRLVKEALSKLPDIGVSGPIPAEVSGRHVHLCPEDLAFLLGKGTALEKLRDISQPGQFLSGLRVKLIGPKGVLERVAVLGPLRDRTQVEVSATDAVALGIHPPVRVSGDLTGASAIHIQAGEHLLHAPGCAIIAARHLHMPPDDARRFGLENGQAVDVFLAGTRPLTLCGVAVRVAEASALCLHIDCDEANAAGIRSGDVCHIRSGSPFPVVPGTRRKANSGQKTDNALALRQEGKSPVLLTEEMVLDASRRQVSVIRIEGRVIVTPLARDALSSMNIAVDVL